MMTKIQSGDVLTVLKYGNTEYFYLGEVRPTAPYYMNGNQVTCTTYIYDVTGDDELNPNGTVITDSDNRVYAPGPRPRNIVRRK